MIGSPGRRRTVDGFAGIGHHIAERLNFAVVAAADATDLQRLQAERGWSRLRLLSGAGSTLKTDLGFEDEDGDQYPGLSVFVRDADGRLIHTYSGSAMLGHDEYRGIDLLSPLWHLQDLTPAGAGGVVSGTGVRQLIHPS
jgi:predicted dithiol-disulfide oxidoreductase (DUF899 family)